MRVHAWASLMWGRGVVARSSEAGKEGGGQGGTSAGRRCVGGGAAGPPKPYMWVGVNPKRQGTKTPFLCGG